ETSFSEAIDFDRMVSNIEIDKLYFTSNNSGQCFDLNSVVNAQINAIYAKNTGNIAIVNYKNTTQQTYSDYANNVPATVLTPSKHVHFDTIYADNCNPSWVAISVEHSFTSSYGACEDITFENVFMNSCGSFGVYPGKNVKVKNLKMKDAKVLTGTS